MIPRAQLVAEREIVRAIAPGCLPPLSPFFVVREDPGLRARRMWSAGKSLALITASTGFDPHEIRELCVDLPRPTIRLVSLSAGGNRPSEASRGRSSLDLAGANAGLSYPERAGHNP